MEPIRLALVGADSLTRDLLRQCLPALEQRLQCVLDATSDVQAFASCVEAKPDLIVYDVTGREAEELVVLSELISGGKWGLMVIGHALPEHVLEALFVRKRSGVYSRKGSLDALAKAIFLVALGGTYIDPDVQGVLERKIVRSAEPLLSQRERHVLQLVGQGYSTKEVANILCLSIKTVEKYRTAVMQKLEVHDVVKLTHEAIRRGLVKL